MPDRSDDYQIPSWPPTRLDREFLNPIFKDLAMRLKAREDLEASFEALQAQGIQASLDYIQVNVAPQIANLQTSIQLAQDQINQIIIDGVSPNSLKLGGQLPSYYATAQALQDGLSGKVSTSLTINGKSLNANITLGKADVGLGNVDNTKDADKPVSTLVQQALDTKASAESTNAALAKRIPVDAAAGFTEAEKTQGRANIGAQAALGWTPVQQGGGFTQNTDKIYIGSNPTVVGAPRLTVGTLDVGTLWNDYLSPKSLGAVGYQKLSSGLIIQWGSSVVTTGGEVVGIPFPLAFPNALASVVVVNGDTNANAPGVVFGVHGKTKTGFTLRTNAFNGQVRADWIAVGN